ncbi:hypothetical protein SEUCBS139899_008050 [Sporothrix eucalyptigena]|uniref:Adenine DNA glycosylase n=1 Tax=Sporothrix eucalyptigena TaxID=1812306 RepID=A0ABP0CSF1_9PEZI
MARSQRASAAAAAKKIQVQSEDYDDVENDINRQGQTTLSTRRSASNKRKREEESPEYDAEAADEGSADDEDVEDDDFDEEEDAKKVKPRAGPSLAIQTGATTTSTAASTASTGPPAPKKRKAPKKTSAQSFALERRLFSPSGRPASDDQVPTACCPPERVHTIDYHRPLLLDGDAGKRARRSLLAWYDSVSSTRGMPWRRGTWLHPEKGLSTSNDPETVAARDELARRAYEVWISEVMAQQTRIAVVIGYWTRWMARWPTLTSLATAPLPEVFQEWSGLGYYSRASRVHEAAKLVATDSDFNGLLPPDVDTLQARIPGVGRYTAGAISAIVYGRPAAMVDGNVIRVLSRQMGMFADSKAEKELVDLLWAAAEALVQAVARDGDKEGDQLGDDEEAPISDRPGRWGQALMELGSTVCTPKPNCAACPISTTCRVYAEGHLLHERDAKGVVPRVEVDVKDSCDLCEQFPELDDEEAAALAKADKKEKKEMKEKKDDKKAPVTKSPFFDVEDAANGITLSEDALAKIVGHARTFPLRRPKKPVREVETLVCAVRVTGKYLLHQRPAKGLLANLWQLPSYDLPAALDGKAARRKEAEVFMARWLAGEENNTTTDKGAKKGTKAKATSKAISVPCSFHIKGTLKTIKVKELGSIPWLFSHLKQTMHVYLFDMDADDGASCLPTPASCAWATVKEAEKTYSMGTGMRKCWDLVRDT